MSLRSQFTATSTQKLKEIVETENSQIKSKNYSDYLSIDSGLNKFRLYPKHPGEESYIALKVCHWLATLDDKNEERRFSVPDSIIHGHTEKDIVEEYINFVNTNLSSTDAEEAAKKKKLTAFPGGLGKTSSWLAYADKIVKDKASFGLWEIKTTVRDALNNASIIEDATEAIEVDPFTDPDNGIPVLVTYNKDGKKPADKYKLQLSKKPLPLTDEQLEAFSKVTPLSQLPQLNYTMTDFESALEGLSYFDSENDINLFDSDEFQQIILEVKAQYETGATAKSAGKKKEAIVKGAMKSGAAVSKKETPKSKIKEEVIAEEEEEEQEPELEVEEEIVEEGDELDAMDRNALKKYIVEKGLKEQVKVFTSDSEDDIRNKIREASNSLVEEPEEEIEEAPAVPEKPVAKPKISNINDIKESLRKNIKK